MARRAGLDNSLDDFAVAAERIPVLANLFPSGNKLMEDFWFAGGLPALLAALGEEIDHSCVTVEGRPIGDVIRAAECYDTETIRSRDNPVVPLSKGRTLVVLRGNLAPNGAIMKTSAATSSLLTHRGPAMVFDDPATMNATCAREDLEITPNHVLILRNAGPVGGPGMPEWGNLPIPKVLLKQGVKDIVRICDGRMSGTHFGTCVLHVSPESAVGGPLALVRDGDMVELDAEAGTLNVDLTEEEMAGRRALWRPADPSYHRSFAALYQRHVSQADQGCDFDFLEGTEPVPEPPIY